MKDVTNKEQVINDLISLFCRIGPEMHCKSDSISTEILKDKFGFYYFSEDVDSKNGLKFECQGSGKCCTSHGEYGFVFLTLNDRQRIAKHFKISTLHFKRFVFS